MTGHGRYSRKKKQGTVFPKVQECELTGGRSSKVNGEHVPSAQLDNALYIGAVSPCRAIPGAA